jgi:hypothetical protein
MYILERYPNLATVSDSNGSIILNVLSKLPSHFQSGHNIGFWKRCIYHCKYFLEVNSFKVLCWIIIFFYYISGVPGELEYGNTIWNALQTLG